LRLDVLHADRLLTAGSLQQFVVRSRRRPQRYPLGDVLRQFVDVAECRAGHDDIQFSPRSACGNEQQLGRRAAID